MINKKIKLLTEESERIYGKTIDNTQNAIDFSDSIFHSTNQLISYNTIRRVYAIVPTKSIAPSKSTLNILAQYCGFASFSDFSDNFNVQNNQVEIHNECYLKFYKKQSVDFNVVNKLCSQKQDFYTFDFLKKTIHIAFTYEDLDFLTQIFELDSVFKNKSYLYFHQNYLIQDIGALLRKYKPLQDDLWSSWSHQKNARLLYFELFVDMDFLIKHHYLAIEKYKQHSSIQQDLVFSNSLLFFKAFMIDDRSGCMEQFKILCSLDIKKMHPIPRARLLTCKLLFSKPTVESIEEIFYWSEFELKNKKNEPPYFHVWMMEGLIMVHQFKEVIRLSNAIKDDPLFQDNRINRGLIQRANTYRAVALIRTGQITEGQNLYKEIDSDKYNLFSSLYDNLFYLALKYFVTNDNKIKVEGENKANEIVYKKLFKMLTEK